MTLPLHTSRHRATWSLITGTAVIAAALTGCASAGTAAGGASAGTSSAVVSSASASSATGSSAGASAGASTGSASSTTAGTSSPSSGSTDSDAPGSDTPLFDVPATCAALVDLDAVRVQLAGGPPPGSTESGPPADAAPTEDPAGESGAGEEPSGPPGADEALPPEVVRQIAGEMLAPLLAARAVAPPEVAEPLAVLATAWQDAEDTGIAVDEFTPEIGEAVIGYETWAHAECGFPTMEVMAADYEFTGVDPTLPAGPVSFSLTNHSDKGEFHAAVVVQFTDGSTPTVDELKTAPVEQLLPRVALFMVADAPPGATSGGLADLAPGHYFLVCPVPVGSGDPTGPAPDALAHLSKGMVVEFDVT